MTFSFMYLLPEEEANTPTWHFWQFNSRLATHVTTHVYAHVTTHVCTHAYTHVNTPEFAYAHACACAHA